MPLIAIQHAHEPSPLVTKAFTHNFPWPHQPPPLTNEGVIGFFVLEAVAISWIVLGLRYRRRKAAEEAEKRQARALSTPAAALIEGALSRIRECAH